MQNQVLFQFGKSVKVQKWSSYDDYSQGALQLLIHLQRAPFGQIRVIEVITMQNQILLQFVRSVKL